MVSFLKYALLSIIVLLTFACSSKVEYPSLVNKGLLGLSVNNPYHGPNLFLAHEFERSTHLLNFFKSRGAPSAIEIVEESFSAPQIFLYYSSPYEVYVAERQEQEGDPPSYQWVTRGAYALKRHDLQNLKKLENAGGLEAVFLLDGKPQRFVRKGRDKSLAVKPALPDYLPPPTRAPTPKPKKRSASQAPKIEETAKPKEESPEFKNLSSDQMALLMAKGYAQRAKNGDLIHTVKSENQNLDEILKWYVGSLEHKEEVLKRSGLAHDKELHVGTKIIIPAALVKQPKQKP